MADVIARDGRPAIEPLFGVIRKRVFDYFALLCTRHQSGVDQEAFSQNDRLCQRARSRHSEALCLAEIVGSG